MKRYRKLIFLAACLVLFCAGTGLRLVNPKMTGTQLFLAYWWIWLGGGGFVIAAAWWYGRSVRY